LPEKIHFTQFNAMQSQHVVGRGGMKHQAACGFKNAGKQKNKKPAPDESNRFSVG